MSTSLTGGQMRRALQLTGELAELRSLEEFPVRATEVLRELIPCEHCGYNAVDFDSGRAIVVAHPHEVVFEGGPEALARLGHQNPMIVRALAGDHTVQRLSDQITRRQLHRTELYRDVYRRIALEYQLGLQLPKIGVGLGRRGQFVGLSLARTHRDFSRADMLMLGLLRPHFVAALNRVYQMALTSAVLAGLQPADRWIVLVDSDDVVAWISDEAEQALGVAVGDRLALHSDVTSWRVPSTYPGLDAMHIARLPDTDSESLRGLGLTKRQAEVLALATHGLSAQQIADALILSRRTVEKHLETIYHHLGVKTRAQAIAVANSRLAHADGPEPSTAPTKRAPLGPHNHQAG